MSWTVTRRPFQSPVALAMSSPTFLGDYKNQLVKGPQDFMRAACPCFIHPKISYSPHRAFPTLVSHRQCSRHTFQPTLIAFLPRTSSRFFCVDTPALMTITYETKGTDLGGQSGRGTDLTTGRSEVDNLFERSNLGRPGRSIDYHEIAKGKEIVVQ